MAHSESTELPFNTGALGGGFIPARPGEPDCGEPGLWIIFMGDAIVLNSEPCVSFIEGERPGWVGNSCGDILIGSFRGTPVRVLEINTTDIPAGHLVEQLLFTFFYQRLPDDLATLAGLAQQILGWERQSRICSLCGGGTDGITGTWGKRCRGCGHEHFPHIHPCAIVLVTRGDELLLIRKPEWPKGYFSLPSGFCDFGESLEECACREVAEETGIRISNLRYVGSQSWPFPAQLMIGFTAEYAEGDIIVDHDELEDAAWFRQGSLPPTFSAKSLAGWMMSTFGKSSAIRDIRNTSPCIM